MSENFRKIKKKYLTVAIVASCILGACLGVAITCALAVGLKTGGVKFHWAIYIPIALVLSAGAGFLFFLILRPDDKRIAKKLDRDFSLNQKVQTMVEFADVGSGEKEVANEIIVLQREQTDEVLGGVAQKRVDLKWLLKFAFVPVVALAMLFAGIFVPAKKTTGPVDPGFDMTNSQEIQLKSLIEDVKGSSLETGLKTFTVLELNNLLEMVRQAEYQSTMKVAVVDAVKNIDGFVADANSYLEIDGVLAKYEVLAPFATAVTNSVVSYKTGATATNLTSINRVNKSREEAEDKIEGVLSGWKNAYLAEYASKGEGETEGTPLPVGEAAEKLRTFADALKEGLADEGLQKYAPQDGSRKPTVRATEEGDGLYNRLIALSEQLSNHAENINGNANGYYENTDGYFTSFISGVKESLAVQSYNCMMDEYIRNALSKIFGVKFDDNAGIAPAPVETEDGDKDENKGNSGGYGDGKHEYGSNDEILDVDTGESKKYSDPVNPDDEEYTYYVKYYNVAMEYLAANPDNVNRPSDEIAAYIQQYFGKLDNGLDEKQN